MSNIGYIRVSTADQNTARQLVDVDLDKMFSEKVSGKARNRPQLDLMLGFIREGDTVHVHSIDRIARNLVDMRDLVTEITKKGCSIVFHKEGLTLNGESDKACTELMLNIMGAFAEFERSIIRERQREGIAAAKSAGKKFGRPSDVTAEDIVTMRRKRAAGVSIRELQDTFNLSRASVYRLTAQA